MLSPIPLEVDSCCGHVVEGKFPSLVRRNASPPAPMAIGELHNCSRYGKPGSIIYNPRGEPVRGRHDERAAPGFRQEYLSPLNSPVNVSPLRRNDDFARVFTGDL